VIRHGEIKFRDRIAALGLYLRRFFLFFQIVTVLWHCGGRGKSVNSIIQSSTRDEVCRRRIYKIKFGGPCSKHVWGLLFAVTQSDVGPVFLTRSNPIHE